MPSLVGSEMCIRDRYPHPNETYRPSIYKGGRGGVFPLNLMATKCFRCQSEVQPVLRETKQSTAGLRQMTCCFYLGPSCVKRVVPIRWARRVKSPHTHDRAGLGLPSILIRRFTTNQGSEAVSTPQRTFCAFSTSIQSIFREKSATCTYGTRHFSSCSSCATTGTGTLAKKRD